MVLSSSPDTSLADVQHLNKQETLKLNSDVEYYKSMALLRILEGNKDAASSYMQYAFEAASKDGTRIPPEEVIAIMKGEAPSQNTRISRNNPEYPDSPQIFGDQESLRNEFEKQCQLIVKDIQEKIRLLSILKAVSPIFKEQTNHLAMAA